MSISQGIKEFGQGKFDYAFLLNENTLEAPCVQLAGSSAAFEASPQSGLGLARSRHQTVRASAGCGSRVEGQSSGSGARGSSDFAFTVLGQIQG